MYFMCVAPFHPIDAEQRRNRQTREKNLLGRRPGLELRRQIVLVHQGDELDGDLFRADRFTLTEQRAASEVALHDLDHLLHALVALGLALREESEVRDFGGGEELRGTVR